MSNADVLKRLFPLPLGLNHEADCDVEGAALDAFEARLADLENEMFPDSAIETLGFWERLYAIVPPDSTNTQARRNAVMGAMMATGGLSRAYFIAVAAAMGYYAVTISEPQPCECGVAECGDRIYTDGINFCWRVDGSGVRPVTYFEAGQSCADDQLSAFPVLDLATVFSTLKPAHTYVYFSEPEDN
jgi:uncharacterized protein YmfQ (DUF2313 family)